MDTQVRNTWRLFGLRVWACPCRTTHTHTYIYICGHGLLHSTSGITGAYGVHVDCRARGRDLSLQSACPTLGTLYPEAQTFTLPGLLVRATIPSGGEDGRRSLRFHGVRFGAQAFEFWALGITVSTGYRESLKGNSSEVPIWLKNVHSVSPPPQLLSRPQPHPPRPRQRQQAAPHHTPPTASSKALLGEIVKDVMHVASAFARE